MALLIIVGATPASMANFLINLAGFSLISASMESLQEVIMANRVTCTTAWGPGDSALLIPPLLDGVHIGVGVPTMLAISPGARPAWSRSAILCLLHSSMAWMMLSVFFRINMESDTKTMALTPKNAWNGHHWIDLDAVAAV